MALEREGNWEEVGGWKMILAVEVEQCPLPQIHVPLVPQM